MTDNTARRRGHGEDAIYFDAAKNRFVGAISVGFGPGGKRIRRKVTGRTKTEVRDKLKAAHNELDRGLHTSATYTVRQAVDDWLEGGLPGRSERTRSIYREALKPLLEHIGLKPLRELTARDVRRGLEALSEHHGCPGIEGQPEHHVESEDVEQRQDPVRHVVGLQAPAGMALQLLEVGVQVAVREHRCLR